MRERKRLAWKMKSLTVYRSLSEDKVLQLYAEILDMLDKEDTDSGALLSSYAEFVSLLLETAELSSTPLIGDLWQNYLLERILQEENVFTLKAEKTGLEEMGSSLLEIVKQDLNSLRECFDLNIDRLQTVIGQRVYKETGEQLLPTLDWQAFKPLERGVYPSFYYEETLRQKKKLYQHNQWTECLEDLANYYRKVGSGDLGAHWAFYWNKGLCGIEKPDPIKLENLIGYEIQRQKVAKNTEQFLMGAGANNLLLYGDRGTGKSSTIKALIHRYGQEGLRILEIHKHQMQDFPIILRQLRERPQRFIIFIDDLSFEEQETEYKYLKAILEGGLEAQPENVLVYATSNRRHLIKESFKDRDDGAQDLHIQDTTQEKLSLSDRFGMTITFLAPTTQDYLIIVDGLVDQKKLTVDKAKVHTLALQWQLWHNGPSGRTAKQFVEDLAGKLKSKKEA